MNRHSSGLRECQDQERGQFIKWTRQYAKFTDNAATEWEFTQNGKISKGFTQLPTTAAAAPETRQEERGDENVPVRFF